MAGFWFLGLFAAAFCVSLATSLITCDEPSPPAGAVFSKISKDVFEAGDELEFTCLPGFMGSQKTMKIVCRSDGTEGDWVSDGYCIRKKCPSLEELNNGDILYSDLGNLFGATVTFICRDGFKLVGAESAECAIVTDRAMGWSKPLPICVPVLCAPPPSIRHGFYSPVKEVFNNLDVVSYQCVPNNHIPYSLIGNSHRICSNGSWTGQDPRCELVLCPYPSVEGGYITTHPRKTYLFRDVVQVGCRPGYRLVGDDSGSTCTEDSRWDPELPRCLPPLDAGTPVGGEDMTLPPEVERTEGPQMTAESLTNPPGLVKPTGSHVGDQTAGTSVDSDVTTTGTPTPSDRTTVTVEGTTGTGGTTQGTTPGYEINKTSKKGRTAIIVVSIFFGVTFILFMCMFLCL